MQQYNLVNSSQLLHAGYQAQPVDIPWGDYGRALIDSTKFAVTSTKDFLFNDPCSEMSAGEKAQIAGQGVIDRSGLQNLQGTLASAAIVVVASEGIIWGYSFYPALMTAAGTPEGQRVLYGIADGLSPNPPTTAEGVIVREITRRMFE